MNNDQTDGRYAPPRARVEDLTAAAAAGEPVLAGRGVRLGASLLDGLIVMGLLWGISLATPWNLFEETDLSGSLALGLIGVGCWFAVHGYLLMTRGQTVGKLLLKIRIVRADGSRASVGRLLGLRYFVPTLINLIPFVGSIFAIANALFIFRDSRQCLHDNLADTIVIQA
jgi:uncharacterized RDD family membrane protein YckC